MYIKITTRCNMTCPHCCYSCGAEGEDMTFATFHALLERWSGLIKESNKYIVVGGGEPTLHPQFWQFVAYGMSYGYVWTATNGSLTQDSLALCRLAQRGYLRGVLSQDEFHDPIDPQVVEAFSCGLSPQKWGMWNPDNLTDQREIRTVTSPYKGGRCREGQDSCPCRGVQIEPNGDVFACGCEGAPLIGSVDKGIVEPAYREGYDLFCGCFKEHCPA